MTTDQPAAKRQREEWPAESVAEQASVQVCNLSTRDSMSCRSRCMLVVCLPPASSMPAVYVRCAKVRTN